MPGTKQKVVALTLIGIVLAAGIAVVAISARSIPPRAVTLSPEIWDQYSQALASAGADSETDGIPHAVDELMSKYPPAASIRLSQTGRLGGGARMGPKRIQGIGTGNGHLSMGAYLAEVFAYVYSGVPGHTNDISPSRVIVPSELAYNRYDFVDTLPRGGKEALRQALKLQFGLVANPEMRGDLVMTVKSPDAPIFKRRMDSQNGTNRNDALPGSTAALANGLSHLLRVKVTDQTGLPGKYDIRLSPPLAPNSSPDQIQQGVTAILGLDLTPDPNGQRVEYIVIQKLP